jgi:uncharacterized iron-regulated protein
MRVLSLVGLLLLALACARAPSPAPRADWVSPIGRDHPLAGRVFDLRTRSESSAPEVLAQAGAARFVLLGESHENADHHRLQAQAIRALGADGAGPAVAFEMLRRDQQATLDEALAGPAPTPEGVRAATGWDQSGWPDFALYAPVFEAALAARLPLVAADLPREEQTLVASNEPLPALLRARLGLDEPLPEDVQRALERDLLAAHCDRLPASELPRMVRVQRARDAALAQALLDAPGEDEAEDEDAPAADARGAGRAVLIAGAEHVRLDRGVPRALESLAPGADRVAVAFLEVDPDEEDPWEDLAARYGGTPVFDYVWYTPKASDEDYCERIRRKE